jgi:hypothetical protein
MLVVISYLKDRNMDLSFCLSMLIIALSEGNGFEDTPKREKNNSIKQQFCHQNIGRTRDRPKEERHKKRQERFRDPKENDRLITHNHSTFFDVYP